ncbi:Uncharacterised protein [Vibrio cholerae]|nr:Uncharacterised protein [Vibrio cholerae]
MRMMLKKIGMFIKILCHHLGSQSIRRYLRQN